jgi:hypothetical protein
MFTKGIKMSNPRAGWYPAFLKIIQAGTTQNTRVRSIIRISGKLRF